MDEIEIEGRWIVPWGLVATADQLRHLSGAEYSDDYSIWRIQAATNATVELTLEDEPNQRTFQRPWGSLQAGSFYLSREKGRVVQELVRAMPSADQRVLAEREIVSKAGFLIADLKSDANVAHVAKALSAWENRREIPHGNDWKEIIDIFRSGDSALQRKGARLVSDWVECAEVTSGPGEYDIVRRVSLATLYRNSGQLDKALKVSEIVELSGICVGARSSVSVLCTTRAATMMDLAELRMSDPADYLKRARLTLNKANALSGGDSDCIREAYRRLKRLDAEYDSRLQLERDMQSLARVGKLPER